MLVFSALGGLHEVQSESDRTCQGKARKETENLADLLTKLLKEWRGITQEEITAVIQSLPRKMRAIVDTRGNTRY